ncbi:MAG: alpha/beta hydrolase [Amnibacterium sp.]
MLIAAVAALAAALCLTLLVSVASTRVRRAPRALRAGAAVAVCAAVVCVALATAALVSAPSARATPTWTGVAAPAPSWQPEALGSGPGYRGIVRWRMPAFPSSTRTVVPAARTAGEVGSVVLPAARSHFRARPAHVYQPPAALTGHPPRLPVVIALSGQSRGAGPTDVVRMGHIAATMDAIARRHHGVAPVVVIPDQLGSGSRNPMCVDSPLGNVATYITTDVRGWILGHLPVAHDRQDWTIAGFSEGGTCSIQFGAGRPDLFGSIVDVSGEQAPLNGTVAHTLAVGFGGSAARYAAAAPFHLLAVHHYTATDAFFGAGALDHHYGSVTPVMAAQAERAGMTAHLRRFAGMKHNWVLARAALQWGLDGLQGWWPAMRAPHSAPGA